VTSAGGDATPPDGATPGGTPRASVAGRAVVYRLFDIGYQVHLDRALDLLAASAPERVRPVRGEMQAIQISNPPLTVILGAERLTLAGRAVDAEVSARLFDFGVLSVRVHVGGPRDASWDEFTAFGNSVEEAMGDLTAIARQHARLLLERLATAIERPLLAPVEEDYIVFRIDGVRGAAVPSDADIPPLLLNERRPLSEAALRELLPHRFSYYADDLAILTWENALVVDTAPGETDVEYVLEFANAQLLEMRYYDALLDAELPRMYDRVEAGRRGRFSFLRRGYARLLGDLQRQVADSTEIVERVDNALKVTDDVYLARIYSAALEIFRGRAWRAGIDRKLGIIRETYSMLNSEAQVSRSEALELTIVLLIVAEIAMALLRPH
jgi:hypothetical protein